MSSEDKSEMMPLILLIDDEKVIRESVRNFLEDYEYRVVEAENGRVGLEVYYRERPDLVMVDLRMPEMDGLEVLGRLTGESPDTPVIIMSGTGIIGDAVEALRLGAWNYLLKPVEDLTVLRHAIENALERSRLIRENRRYQEHLEEEVNRRTREVEETTEELRQSEEKYRTIFENLQDVYFETRLDGTIAEVSPSVQNISRYTREEILNTSLWDIYEDAGEREVILKKLRVEKTVTDYEVHLRDKGGRIIPCAITAQLRPDRSTSELKVFGTIRDISERKRSEEEKQRLMDQLHQAQKMEAIASLTGGIAHDFNNLLTVINGHAEIALKRAGKGQDVKKDLNTIMQAGRRAENLTRQLLAFGRKQVYQPRVLDINDVIRDLDKMMRRLIGEDIQMVMKSSPEVPPIKADPGQLEQILINLMVNARDAIMERDESSEYEKRITIETGSVALESAFVVDHPGSSPGLHTLLAVSDSGVGMGTETRNKIFEPFFTTKEKGKGTGLGMSTVYGIVKQNNGSIYVYSEPGQGTTFRIYWPSSGEPKTPEEDEPIGNDVKTGTETILLVEDDEDVRGFALDTLEDLGYRVYEAANGKKAMDMMKGGKLKVDLLLTDLIMPEMNGKDLAEKLQKRIPGLSVLYASGYTDEHIFHRYQLAQDVHYLQKPYSVQALAQKVRDALDE